MRIGHPQRSKTTVFVTSAQSTNRLQRVFPRGYAEAKNAIEALTRVERLEWRPVLRTFLICRPRSRHSFTHFSCDPIGSRRLPSLRSVASVKPSTHRCTMMASERQRALLRAHYMMTGPDVCMSVSDCARSAAFSRMRPALARSSGSQTTRRRPWSRTSEVIEMRGALDDAQALAHGYGAWTTMRAASFLASASARRSRTAH